MLSLRAFTPFILTPLLLLHSGLQHPAAMRASQSSARHSPAAVPVSRFTDEQEWIVSDVAATVARWSAVKVPAARVLNVSAMTVRTLAPTKFAVRFAPTVEPIPIEVAGHIWSAETYRPLVDAMMSSSVVPTEQEPDLAVRDGLANLTPASLLDANRRVTEHLTEHPRSASAHESAALLAGAFALRESANWFTDVRPALSRMSSHLAVALVLRGTRGEGADGTLARAILEVLVGHQRAAMAIIDGYEPRASRAAELWAGFHQRHLMQAMMAVEQHSRNVGRRIGGRELVIGFQQAFGSLELFPLVRHALAGNAEEYRFAMDQARTLVQVRPELVTQSAWTRFLKKPAFPTSTTAFPLDLRWFTTAVPSGTAFDLAARALIPGCPRPPTLQQVAEWAQQMPWDHWTLWGNEWLPVEGRPSLAHVVGAFGPLLDYDTHAVYKILEYMALPPEQRIVYAGRLCDLAAGKCHELAKLLLLVGRDAEAAVADERWFRETRDRVSVSTESTWLMRYHLAHGDIDRAGEIAANAGETGSLRGLALEAEFLERTGRAAEAERALRDIGERYSDTVRLGEFVMRRAIAAGDRQQQLDAAELLRDHFPQGLERLVPLALPVQPEDGVRFATFGSRHLAMGFQPTDVIVGVDGWRVHDFNQYSSLARLSFDATMTVHVWRAGKYQTLTVRVPERLLGAELVDYEPAPGRPAV